MRAGGRQIQESGIIGAIALLLFALPARAQRARQLVMEVSPPVNRSLSGAVAGQPGGELVREIDDPHTGDRWLLFRDNENPGGPGRLVRVEAGYAGRYLVSSALLPVNQPVALNPAEPPALPVIRTGDALTVEENTPVVEAHLEAVAMGPAAVGARLQVRLKIGGKVLRAVALAQGRAALLPEGEAW
jgi:hypothetical protein